MKESTDYRVVSVAMGFSTKKAVTQLTLEVNEAFARGWKATGGVTLVGTHLMQAMVRHR